MLEFICELTYSDNPVCYYITNAVAENEHARIGTSNQELQNWNNLTDPKLALCENVTQ